MGLSLALTRDHGSSDGLKTSSHRARVSWISLETTYDGFTERTCPHRSEDRGQPGEYSGRRRDRRGTRQKKETERRDRPCSLGQSRDVQAWFLRDLKAKNEKEKAKTKRRKRNL